jgi:hypothetical protein
MIDSKTEESHGFSETEHGADKRRSTVPPAISQTSLGTPLATEERPGLNGYVRRFVSNWQKRQDQFPLHEAAKKRAEQDWQAEQDRDRSEARRRHG